MALIEPLKKIAEEQLDLLRVALYVASEGSAKFEGEVLTCSLTEPKRRTSTLLAMAAGQSINTILRMSELRGIAVRDVYPITRSAVETFINAAFLLSEEDSVAERAIRYVSYAGWKHTNRVVGSGEFALTISSDPDPEGTVANLFPEFSGSGKGSWTSFDTGSRIRRVGELAGCKAGSRLLAAYALIYNISSEIIHGSTYGVSYFYGTHSPHLRRLKNS